jgi:ABC-type xylose transport system permease subunit
MVWQIVLSTGAGAFSGLITALLGYAKSSTMESFDPKKAVQTIIVGAIVGGFAGAWGVTYQQAYEYLGSIGGIVIIEYVKKAVWRRLSPPE